MDALNRISLPGLRAVDSVARSGNLARAAEMLGVTPGAVSQQVILVERQLGLKLFQRQPGGMVPTARGQEVVDLLAEGFAQIGAAVARAARERDDILTISVAPVFAARWLIWRLPRFQAAYPGIKVRLDADLALANPSIGDVDLCLRVGRGDWPGVNAERLFPQVIFPVCSPEVARHIDCHADLAKVPVIREARADFDWPDWLGPEGHGGVTPADGAIFSDSMLCLDAAMTGAGVFLSFETLAVDALANGRLVEPFRGRHVTANAYWLVTAQDSRPKPAAAAFARWLKSETAAAGLGTPRSA